ncbi:DUF418 domain-containing protein [Erythrobacter mangrovi]|uniref:DUF418 domain-containing protein n=1 Tax=Erythrobacter mangrovi TaxID=2739433 RepID=A0A7D3XA21_9SPHN|nr:DUF418 domain-containing protein [Erythrobacter mangrovi]QKG70470.1 DUF418 domain-containing protein [Erythrobacter mangrovi]
MPEIAAPVAKGDRIDSLDTLRGIAVFGILLMNISAFGLLWQAYGNPYAAGGSTGLDLKLFEIMNVGFEGTMRGIFSMLFGAGIVLMAGRLEKSVGGLSAADVHLRRMSWLMLFGVIHWALLLWTGEILFAYSLCGFVLFSFRNMIPRYQLAIGVAALLVAGIMNNNKYEDVRDAYAAAATAEATQAAGTELTDEQHAAIAHRDELAAHQLPNEDTTVMMEGWHSGSYLNAVRSQFDFSYDFQWTGLPYWLFFDMMPFMLIGMALLKLGVLSASLPARSYALMLVVGYAIGIPLGLYELGILQSGQYSTLVAEEANRTYQISRLAMVVGHIGLVLLVVKLGWLRWLQRGFAAAGQMALTNYIGQTLICTMLFYGFGFGLYGELTRSQLYLVVLTIAVVEMFISVLWLRSFRFGPLEWLWRSLTYWQRQPMRIGGGAPPRAPELAAA